MSSAELSPDASQLWSSMRQPTTADRIAERIIGHITAQRLLPGARLPSERELAALLGVSRPSLREAMRSLQAQGHVIVRHGSGVYVAEPSASQVLRQSLGDEQLSMRELYDMREVIELAAAEWAARRRDREQLSAVQHAHDELEEASVAAEIDFERLAALDTSFHLRIVEAAGNRFLTQTLGVLHDILATGMRTTLTIPGRLERSRRDHERICRAIMAGDPVAARRAAKAHVQAARRAALRRLENEQPAPASPRAAAGAPRGQRTPVDSIASRSRRSRAGDGEQ